MALLKDDSQFVIPGFQLPSFRSTLATQRGVDKNILFHVIGGIGDQLCAEPTLRFALDNFKDVEISLATRVPEFFTHLKFKKVYDLKQDKPPFDEYFVLSTYIGANNLIWDFVSHGLTHCVDYPSILAMQGTIPIEYKAIQLPVQPATIAHLEEYTKENYVAVHASKNWPSSTYPPEFWNSVIERLIEEGCTPVLFGKEISAVQGTVATTTVGCVDLRNKLSLIESAWLLQRMRYFICNDSSPYHMAVPGRVRIAFIATAKHHDFIYHWRRNLEGKLEWGWNSRHFNKGGMWSLTDRCPNKEASVKIDVVDPNVLSSWLPSPTELTNWLIDRQ